MMTTCHSGARRISLMSLLLIAMVVCVPARLGFGQGTSDQLPDPMTSFELLTYMKRLDLSDQQTLAVEQLFEQYQSEFRFLRENDIERYMEETRKLQSQGAQMPERKVVERFFRRTEVVRRKISDVDNLLFARIQTVLTDAQQSGLEQVRWARERDRYQQGMTSQMLFGQAPVDASAFVYELSLPDSTWEAINPLLVPYEYELTTFWRSIHKDASQMFLRMFERLEELGFDPQSIEDNPEKMVEMSRTLQQLMMEGMADARNQADKQHSKNRHLIDSIALEIHDHAARASLLEGFYAEAYPQAAPLFKYHPLNARAASQLDGLDAETQEAFESMATAYETQVTVMQTNMLQHLEELRHLMNPLEPSYDEMTGIQEKIFALQQQYQELQNDHRTTLIEMLTSEQLTSLTAQSGATTRVTVARRPSRMEVVAESFSDVPTPASVATGPDQFLPAKISKRDIERFARVLSLNELDTEILEGIYAAYSETYDAVIDPVVEKLHASLNGMFRFDADGQFQANPDTSAIEETYAHRQNALKLIEQQDAVLFADMGVFAPEVEDDTTLERLQLRRLREVYRRGESSSSEASIDLSHLLSQGGTFDVRAHGPDQWMVVYERALTALFRERHAATRQLQKVRDEWTHYVNANFHNTENGRSSTELTAEYMTTYRKQMEDPERRLKTVARAIVDLNTSTMQSIAASVNEDQMSKFQDLYNRRAFPSVYHDPLHATDPLRASLALSSLDGSQRDRVRSLLEEYEPAYEALCQKMVANKHNAPSLSMSLIEEDWTEYQERQNVEDRLKYERDELSSRMLRRLRMLLQDDQIEAIGGLPQLGRDY